MTIIIPYGKLDFNLEFSTRFEYLLPCDTVSPMHETKEPSPWREWFSILDLIY